MGRLRYIPVVLAVVVVAAAGARAAFSSHTAVSSTMHAYVHEDSSIGLTFDDGTNVGSQAANPPSIPAGTYTIRVEDDAFTHNFHLAGPGVEVFTTIGGMGTPTWTVTFQSGARYLTEIEVGMRGRIVERIPLEVSVSAPSALP